MKALEDFRMYGRYVLGLRRYLREPQLTWEETVAIVKRGLDEREDNFLRVVERGVYGHGRSPYRKLLQHAGCEFGDLRDMVRRRGLEQTLQALHDTGVYVDFEEFKGRKPIVRSGLTLPVSANDFDNPLPRAGFYIQTSGSTGKATRTPTDLDFYRDRAPHFMIMFAVHNMIGAELALWRGTLPANASFDVILLAARFGHVPRRWFTPVDPREFRAGFRNRAAHVLTIAIARSCGVPIPTLEVVKPDQAVVIARWMADTLNRGRHCALNAPLSSLMRVSIAACDAGLDLGGAVLLGAGEPPTPAKVQAITRSGARYAANYWFSEGGHIGTQCANPIEINDIHLFADAIAMIQSPQPVPGTDETVDAFCYTSLLPSSPKILLNVAIDDFGIVEQRNCGCLLHELGYSTHLRAIQSAAKLTGEGMTLVGSDMVRILQEVLPQRFGGTPLDYQLQEVEDEKGFTRLNLVVDPRVDIAHEDAVVDIVLRELERSNAMANVAQALWANANTLRVVRARPFSTSAGKQPPLHVVRRN